MKALIYQGPGKKALEERPTPTITAPTDAIVKVTKRRFVGLIFIFLKVMWQPAYLAVFLGMKELV